MKLAVLFFISLLCLIGVVLGVSSGAYAFSPGYNGNPYQHAAVPVPPPPFPPPGYGGGYGAFGHGEYGYGGKRGIGIGGIVLGILGFFFIIFILFMGFGFFLAISKLGSDTDKQDSSAYTRPVIVVSDSGVTQMSG